MAGGWLVPLFGLVLLPLSSIAQEPQFKQMEILQPQTLGAPYSTRTQMPEVEDEEIGKQFLLRRKEAIPQFAITGDAQYFYTSNALLLDKAKQDDFVFVGSAVASWNPTWIKEVTGSVFVRQQFFRYNRHSEIDFDASAAGFNAGGSVEDWFTLSGGYTATRLESRPTDDEFYKEGDASIMISRLYKFNDRLVLPYGYTFDFYHTSPSDYTRLTHGFFVGLNWAAMQKMLVQLFYRFQYEDYQQYEEDYQQIDRADKASILSLAATYQFTNWASARAFLSWTSNDSSINRDYEIFNTGAGVSLALRF